MKVASNHGFPAAPALYTCSLNLIKAALGKHWSEF